MYIFSLQLQALTVWHGSRYISRTGLVNLFTCFCLAGSTAGITRSPSTLIAHKLSGNNPIGLSKPLTLRWKYASEFTVGLTPTVAQERVYLPLGFGTILCLGVVDGALQWKSETGGEISASPVADEHGVYIASSTNDASAAFTGNAGGALRAMGREGGVTLWMRTLTAPVQGALTATQTTIFGGARDGKIYSIQKSTGEIVWAKQFPAAFDSSPLVAESRLYIGSEDGSLFAVDQTTGTTLWRYRTHGAIRGKPVLVDGLLFFGSLDGYVYALRATDGRLRWRTRTGAGVQSLIGTSTGLLAPSLDNFVYMLSFARGNRVWKHQLTGRLTAPPLAANDGALFTPLTGEAGVVLDLRDGRQLNTLPLGADSATAAAPVIAGELLLLTTRHGLLAFSHPLSPAAADASGANTSK